MELFDFQTTLVVALILTATAAVVLFDYVRRHRRLQQPLTAQGPKMRSAQAQGPQEKAPQRQAPKPEPASPLQRSSQRIFEAAPPAPVEYAPPKRLSDERPLEPMVAVAMLSRPIVEPRIPRDTITVEFAPPTPAPSPDSPDSKLPAINLPPFTIDAELWERLIASQPKKNMLSAGNDLPGSDSPGNDSPAAAKSHTAAPASAVEPAPYMIFEDQAPADPQSGGMIQQPVLEKWMETEQRFTGLVVSIGINDADSGMWHSRGLMQSVGAYIAGLLKAKDYCCRTSFDEFVLVCPGEQGAQAQRRLNHVSERLWDYQLRGMGACSILFSWGGVQVKDQPLAEAIASAGERMRETKRSSPAAPTQQQFI